MGKGAYKDIPVVDELIGYEDAAEGLYCPKCRASNHFDERHQPVEQTECLFTGDMEEFDHEPGYTWEEGWLCKCGTKYKYRNGC